VSELTGIAIPSYYELKVKGRMDIYNNLIRENKDQILSKIRLKTLTPSQLLYIANAWNSKKTGFLFKKYQITNYDWLSSENLARCIERLDRLMISRKSIFEKEFEVESKDGDHKELFNR
jgi:hypothetical protein